MIDLRGKKVTVVGLGRTAIALVKLLLREGAQPFVTESDRGPKYEALGRTLDELGVPYECGGHTSAGTRGTDFIIPSPGVPPTIPVILQARERGAGLINELDYAAQFCSSRILALTGTNGKTTTTELLRALVKACGHSVSLAGNNDVPLSAAVMDADTPQFMVVEVSSYQLETATMFHPWIACVLNVTPDHLKRHKTIENYASVKSSLFARQGAGDFAVLNADDPRVATVPVPANAARWMFSLEHPQRHGLWLDRDTIRAGQTPVASRADTPLPGRHNLQNVLAALTMMRAGGFDWERTLDGLRAFTGVEHRIEYVTEINGARFYNDSKSTNVDSLKVALESFSEPIVLIAGGEGKGSDYGVLRDLVRQHVKQLVTLGQDAPLLEAAFGEVVTTERASDMHNAVARAATAAGMGDVVLLSPACASFDMFDNFEHRGRVFKDAVRAYQREKQR